MFRLIGREWFCVQDSCDYRERYRMDLLPVLYSLEEYTRQRTAFAWIWWGYSDFYLYQLSIGLPTGWKWYWQPQSSNVDKELLLVTSHSCSTPVLSRRKDGHHSRRCKSLLLSLDIHAYKCQIGRYLLNSTYYVLIITRTRNDATTTSCSGFGK